MPLLAYRFRYACCFRCTLFFRVQDLFRKRLTMLSPPGEDILLDVALIAFLDVLLDVALVALLDVLLDVA